jgi:hypothetical protein
MKLGRRLKHLPIKARVVKLVDTAALDAAGRIRKSYRVGSSPSMGTPFCQ